jgi:hypothetical protein
VIFRKTNFFTDSEKLIIDTNASAWLQGQGNLEVKPLHNQTALVKWPKGEQFIPHKHWVEKKLLFLKECLWMNMENIQKVLG